MVSLHYLMQRNIFTRIKLIKKYLFNKEKFMDETNATSKDVREIESDLQTTNHDIKTRIMLDMKMVTSLDMSVL